MSLLEALQAGTAIVASDVDGIPEDVTNERDALLVAPGDRGALEAALTRVCTDARLRTRLQTRAGHIHAERFAAPHLVAALAATYAELGLTSGDSLASEMTRQ